MRKAGGTVDPHDVYNGGALLPMGSDKDRGGHKGYCLSAMVDLLCGPLSGANWGPFTPPSSCSRCCRSGEVGKGIGHFFGACPSTPSSTRRNSNGKSTTGFRTFRATKPAPGTDGPLIPGDPERLAEAVESRRGIPLLGPVVDDLREVSRRTGMPFE